MNGMVPAGVITKRVAEARLKERAKIAEMARKRAKEHYRDFMQAEEGSVAQAGDCAMYAALRDFSTELESVAQYGKDHPNE